MTDHRPLPPPTIQSAALPTTEPGWMTWLTAVAVGAACAALAGGGAGLLAAAIATSSCSANDGWCELGGALVGFAVAVVVGLIGYAIGGVVTVVRRRPTGPRAWLIGATLATPVGGALGLTVLGAIVNSTA